MYLAAHVLLHRQVVTFAKESHEFKVRTQVIHRNVDLKMYVSYMTRIGLSIREKLVSDVLSFFELFKPSLDIMARAIHESILVIVDQTP